MAFTVVVPSFPTQVSGVLVVVEVMPQGEHAGIPASEVITRGLNGFSYTWIGNVPGGVAVAPVANVFHDVTVTSHPGGNPQFPAGKQALQSVVVTSSCHV